MIHSAPQLPLAHASSGDNSAIMTRPKSYSRHISFDRNLVWKALEEGKSYKLPCSSKSEVHSRVLALNRWRRQVIEDQPQLGYVKFRKQFDPHMVLIEPANLDIEILDGDGNPAGFTIRDLIEEDARRQEEAEEARQHGMTLEQYREWKQNQTEMPEPTEDEPKPEPEIHSSAQDAIDAAEREKGRELTDEERQSIIQSFEGGKIEGPLF